MLSTEEVKINTMQVEIKSMMVGKKQLTLSLMRQIIEEPLIDEENLLFRGVPWGHVNYFWGDDKHKTYPRHINVVWQKGNVLRRSVIEMEIRYKQYSEDVCRKEISQLLKDIAYYKGINPHLRFENKLQQLQDNLRSHQDELKKLEYLRDIYIPKYHQLVEPLKILDHFYIAV